MGDWQASVSVDGLSEAQASRIAGKFQMYAQDLIFELELARELDEYSHIKSEFPQIYSSHDYFPRED